MAQNAHSQAVKANRNLADNVKNESADLVEVGKTQISDLSSRALQTAHDVIENVQDKTQNIEKQLKQYSRGAIRYAKQNPAYAIAGAVGVGLVLGAFLARRKK